MFWTEDYHLVNLHDIPDEEIKKRKVSGILEFFMKHIHKPDLLGVWEKIAPSLKDIMLIIDEDYIKLFLSYTLTLVEKNDTVKLKELLVQNLSEEKGESTVTSFAQHWFDEGLHKGLDQGKLEGKLEDARNMLKYGLEVDLNSKITGIPISKLKMLVRNEY